MHMLMCVNLPMHMCNRHQAEKKVHCLTTVCLGKAQESLGFLTASAVATPEARSACSTL